MTLSVLAISDKLEMAEIKRSERCNAEGIGGKEMIEDCPLEEDIRKFIERVTLHLQSINSNMFMEAYTLYTKYNVEQGTAHAELRIKRNQIEYKI